MTKLAAMRTCRDIKRRYRIRIKVTNNQQQIIYVLNPIIWQEVLHLSCYCALLHYYYYSLFSRLISAFIFIFQPMTANSANQYPKFRMLTVNTCMQCHQQRVLSYCVTTLRYSRLTQFTLSTSKQSFFPFLTSLLHHNTSCFQVTCQADSEATTTPSPSWFTTI